MRKIILIICTLLILFFACYIYTVFNGTIWGKVREKKGAVEYVQNEYNINVKVVSVDFSFKNQDYIVTVHPINNPSLVFNVSRQMKSSGELVYVDNYIAVLNRTNNR